MERAGVAADVVGSAFEHELLFVRPRNEAIVYRIIASREGPTGPVVLAGPTADGDDVLYQRTRYELPLAVRPGDYLDVLSTGAYSSAYAAPEFHGLGALPVHILPLEQT